MPSDSLQHYSSALFFSTMLDSQSDNLQHYHYALALFFSTMLDSQSDNLQHY
ncbi:hypothetical protein DPMN_141727, partial [Dreissena polymorpha]